MKQILTNRFILPIVTLIAGVAIGAIFYPSKSIVEEEYRQYKMDAEIQKRLDAEEIKILESQIEKKEEEHKEFKRETSNKISSLRTENIELKQKTKETKVKIIKPDGTITEKTYKESDTQVVSQVVTSIKQEFNEKVASIENKWKTIHEKRVVDIKRRYEEQLSEKQKIIDTQYNKKVVEVNKRRFGISLGYTNQEHYFSSLSYDVSGPIFLDAHIDSKFSTPAETQFGLGLGLRF